MINGKYFWLCFKAAVEYIPQNIYMSFLTLAICVVLGTGIAMVRAYRVPVLNIIFDVLMAFCKALPANLVLLICFIIYTTNFSAIADALHIKAGIRDINMLYIAVVALVICSISGISEVIRSGLIAVDRGQYEAGYSVGLSKSKTFFRIILPQAVRAIIPPLTNSILSLVKNTALVSVIGVMDIMNGATTAANVYYCYLESYIAASIVFWGIGLILEIFSHQVEKYFTKSVKRAV